MDNNKRNLHHLIQNIHNLCVTFLVFLETAVKTRGVFLNRFLFFMILLFLRDND